MKFMSKILKKGDKYKNWTVINDFEIKDYHCHAIHLRHETTGLEVLHYLTDDTHNLFCFAFRTPNPENTGAAHIMEHSVLCGSEKYPLKDPFTQLSNQSVKTYLNALTMADRTLYPGSSIVKADYFNLMSVYGDAVFFPRLTPEIFAQEAHRIEIDKNGEPQIQGVVYNEMKGCYSDFTGVALDAADHALLKGSIFEKDSGGDPLEIPSLTYEKYLEFHKKWYKPENCLVFLYGDIPTVEQLDFLEKEILNRLEKRNPEFKWSEKIHDEIIKQHLAYVTAPEVKEPLSVRALGPAGQDSGKKSTVFVTWNIGLSTEAAETMEKVMLSRIFFNNDGTPLRKALESSELGEDTAPGCGLSVRYTTLYSVGLRGVKSEDVSKVKDLIFNTLEKIVEDGISEEEIDSAFMEYEFYQRYVKQNPGLVYKNKPIDAWVYGFDIEKFIVNRAIIKQVKEKFKTEKGYIESLIKKFFLDNKSYVVSEIVPSEDFVAEREKAEKKIIQELLASTSLDEIKKQNDKLHQFQTSKDDVSCLPNLKPQDFIGEIDKFLKDCEIGFDSIPVENGKSVNLFTSAAHTNGITNFDVYYPIDALDLEDYPWITLFTSVVSDCGWGNLDWAEAARVTALHTGGIYAGVQTTSVSKSVKSSSKASLLNVSGREWICFSLEVLDEKIEEGLKLLADNINLVNFKDSKRIKNIAVELRNDVESSVIPNGHHYAITRCCRHTNRSNALDDLFDGLSFVINLHQQSKADPKETGKRFEKMFNKLKTGGGFIHIITEKETIEKAKPAIETFAKSINLLPLQPPQEKNFADIIALTDINGPVKSGECECFKIPGQSGFASQVTPATQYGLKLNGPEDVAAHWLSQILLWERIRTVGGAYGGFCSTESVNGLLRFATYRDPTPELSCDVFDKCVEEACSIDFTEQEVEKAVMGTFSDYIRPKNPAAMAKDSFIRFLHAIEKEDRKEKILSLLTTDAASMKKALNNLSKLSKDNKYRVIMGSGDYDRIGKTVNLPL